MNIAEQKIWDYLDGKLSSQEKLLIEDLIETDPFYKTAFEELKSLNDDLALLELDEPSMSFNRNVMEKVAFEPVPGSIKSLIDKRIVNGISAFFLLTIVSLLLILFLVIDWSSLPRATGNQLDLLEFNYSGLWSSTVINTFFFIDVILAILFIDGFVRKRIASKKLKNI